MLEVTTHHPTDDADLNHWWAPITEEIPVRAPHGLDRSWAEIDDD